MSAAAVVTAGAYVAVDGRFAFAVGATPAAGRLPVIRLGGHREPGEGAWACAAREVREEASLTARPLPPPATYWTPPPHDPAALVPAPWPAPPGEAVAPILVAWREEAGQRLHSLMFLAVAEGPPEPAAETAALLLLRPAEVHALARTPVTLGAFLAAGGRAVLRPDQPLPADLLLEPFFQLRALATLLARHPDLLPALG